MDEPLTPRGFRVAAAIAEGFRVLAAEAAPLTLLVVLFYFAPDAVVETLRLRGFAWVIHPGVAWAGVLAAHFVLVSLCAGATAKLVIDRLDGRPPSLLTALAAGVRAIPVALALILVAEAPELPLLWFPASFGPGMALMAVFANFALNLGLSSFVGLAVPAAAGERRGPVSAFVRAWRLARGARWRLFLLTLIYLVAFVVAQIVASGVAGGSGEVQAYVVSAAAALTTLVDAAVTPVAFVQLRRLNDGAQPGAIAGIFD